MAKETVPSIITTIRPPTGLLAGGCLARIGTILRFHPGQSEGDTDSENPISPSKGNGGSTEQGTSSLWTSPMAIDGQHRQQLTDNGPPRPQQPYPTELPIPTLLPIPDERGPSSGADLCHDRSTNQPIIFYSKKGRATHHPSRYPERNLQSSGDSQEEKRPKRAGDAVCHTKNGLTPPRLSEIDRVQHGSKRDSSGPVSQNNDQVWNEPSLRPNNGPLKPLLNLTPVLSLKRKLPPL
ncbi:hypothetical protein A4A49_40163 [Nicotiana attenuata]|uniref:Uncharacterized protein n=1 Tax=Nicotiana attenuata TaxID=49451 RepID=A0A1J6JQL2_NICAT|nr:hypothetical protein A4A49_40163 [Nicotiana attenuata]